MYTKEIVYDRISHDFALYLDGAIVGYARSYVDGERTLDELVASIQETHRNPAAYEAGVAEASPIIEIIDPQHPDCGCVVYRTRPAGPQHIEYRDGGCWLRLHISQYREMTEDEQGRVCTKVEGAAERQAA